MRARIEWILHEAGYDYESIPSLTIPEIRRLLEGQRVDNEITNMIQEQQMNDRGRGGTGAYGRTIPRESDNELLEEYADRADSNGISASWGGG